MLSSSSKILMDWFGIPMDDIGLYSNGYIMGDYAVVITSAMVVAVSPRIQELYRGQQFSNLRRLYLFCQCIALAISFLLAIWMPQIYRLFIHNEQLQPAALELLNYGVKRILLEKPGFGYPSEIDAIVTAAHNHQATVLVAYNRRFYSSVLKAEEIIAADGGVVSFNFEFTEWAHVITAAKHLKRVNLETLLVNNSAHVIDTAFFLGGQPAQISCYRAGEGNLSWHPTASIFAGAGISDRGAIFSYCANWEAPGRWAVEVLTRKHRLYFKPMETLQIQELGSVAVNPVEVDNHLDVTYKPGFYLQTKAFAEGNYDRFCTIEQQLTHLNSYYKAMSGYVN